MHSWQLLLMCCSTATGVEVHICGACIHMARHSHGKASNELHDDYCTVDLTFLC
jgi:hypothetical protein